MTNFGQQEYLSTSELACLLRVSKRTVRLLTKKGVIPAIRLGRVYRYGWAEVNAALQLRAFQMTENESPEGELM